MGLLIDQCSNGGVRTLSYHLDQSSIELGANCYILECFEGRALVDDLSSMKDNIRVTERLQLEGVHPLPQVPMTSSVKNHTHETQVLFSRSIRGLKMVMSRFVNEKPIHRNRLGLGPFSHSGQGSPLTFHLTFEGLSN